MAVIGADVDGPIRADRWRGRGGANAALREQPLLGSVGVQRVKFLVP